MNDVATDLGSRSISKGAGAEEVLVGLVYSISPVHTDDYYARARTESPTARDVDVLNLKDPGGLLTPERVRTLVPALRDAAPNLPLEVHSHMTATLGGASYLEAARHGASFVCTAVRPLANGTSQPSAEETVASLRARVRRRARRRRARGDVRLLRRRSRPGSAGRSACLSSTTPASTGTSCRAG